MTKVVRRFLYKNIDKIDVTFDFNEHILPILLINFINVSVKAIKYKEYLNSDFSKTVCLIWLKFEN